MGGKCETSCRFSKLLSDEDPLYHSQSFLGLADATSSDGLNLSGLMKRLDRVSPVIGIWQIPILGADSIQLILWRQLCQVLEISTSF